MRGKRGHIVAFGHADKVYTGQRICLTGREAQLHTLLFKHCCQRYLILRHFKGHCGGRLLLFGQFNTLRIPAHKFEFIRCMLHGSGRYRDLVAGMGVADRFFAVRNRHSSHNINIFIAISHRRCGNGVPFRSIFLEGNACDLNTVIGHYERERVAGNRNVTRRNSSLIPAFGQRNLINDHVLIFTGRLDAHGDRPIRTNIFGNSTIGLRQVLISAKLFGARRQCGKVIAFLRKHFEFPRHIQPNSIFLRFSLKICQGKRIASIRKVQLVFGSSRSPCRNDFTSRIPRCIAVDIFCGRKYKFSPCFVRCPSIRIVCQKL